MENGLEMGSFAASAPRSSKTRRSCISKFRMTPRSVCYGRSSLSSSNLPCAAWLTVMGLLASWPARVGALASLVPTPLSVIGLNCERQELWVWRALCELSRGPS